jgi:hypothetical protein
MEFQLAVAAVAAALKEDEALSFAYQANIAQAFIDEHKRHNIHITDETLREIANNAAKNYIGQFVGAAIAPVAPKAEEPSIPEELSTPTNDKSSKRGGK